MASVSDSSLARSAASPLRAMVVGGIVLVGIAIGLRVMTAEETSFYRTHGMVPDAHTAVRLAELVLADPRHGCTLADRPSARLDGGVWTVEAQPTEPGLCRVLLDRKDGQVLKVEALR